MSDIQNNQILNQLPPNNDATPVIDATGPVAGGVSIENTPLPQPGNTKKNRIILYIVVFLLAGIVTAILLGVRTRSNAPAVADNSQDISQLLDTSKNTIPSQSQTPSTECNSPMAPSNVRPYVRCNYRQSKISFIEAKAVEDRISQTVGSIRIPSDLVFEHEEVYRGIPIKWTSSQPISPNVLSWLKAGLDILPDYFYVEHPLTAIISATDKELGSQTLIKPGPSTLAYASGLNIFLTETTAKGGSTYYPTDKASVINTLFHEWVHVVQHYEALQTFNEEYLAKNRIVEAMATGPLEKGFAKEVGWVYNSDECGDGIIAKLKDDAESQKTTEYGRSKVREDMAESGALFMLCKSNQISEARVLWWEKMTGKNRSEFCPSKI